MRLFHTLLPLCLLALVGCNAGSSSSSQPTADTAMDLSQFRYPLAQMETISNPTLLAHRNFYSAPSQGPDAAWFDAVKQGNLAKVQAMVEAGQNLEAKDEASLGQTALGWAAFIGYEDIVHYLVDHGADIRATDRADVYNALKSAVMGPNVEVVKYLHGLLKDETDFDARESDQETLFMVAAVDGRVDTVKYMLQFKPDVNAVAVNENPKLDESPLSGACEHGFTEMAALLIANGAVNHKTGRASCD